MDGWIIHKLKNMVMSEVVEQKAGDKFIPEKGSTKGLVVNSNKEE